MIIDLQPTDDFDAVLEFVRPGDTIQLSRGRHTTRGNWAHRGWGYGIHGVSIRGPEDAGVPATLALANPVMEVEGVFRPDLDVNILWLGADCSVAGVDFDCSLPEFPTYRTGGLRFHGPYSVRNCRLTGLRGDLAAKIEVFAISSQGNTGGSEVLDVTVSGVKANSYVSGIFLGATIAPSLPSKVMRCEVHLGTGNQFCYSANYDVTFTGCRGSGAFAFFHNDTNPTRNVHLVSCSGSSSSAAFQLIGVGDSQHELGVTDCEVESERALVLWETRGAMRGGVVLNRCRLPARYAATCISPRCSASFLDCELTPDAECQYRAGTQPPVFLQINGLAPSIRFVETQGS